MVSQNRQPAADPGRLGRAPTGFLAAAAACCLLAVLVIFAVVSGGPAPAAAGLALAVLPVPVVMAGVLYLDRLEPEPRTLLSATFGAGAAVAAVIGLAGHAVGSELITTPELGPAGGRLAATSLGGAFIGALIAESVKGAVLLGLLRYRRAELDGTTDGVVYASMTGLGFALVSNLFAYVSAERSGFAALASAFLQRGLLAPLWDPLFSAMVGIGIAYAAAVQGRRGRWAIAGGWAAAVLLHTLWDDSVRAGAARTAMVYVILLCVLGAVLGAVIADRRRIVGLVTSLLPPFENPAVMTAEDLDMLASLRWRRIARQWARLHAGLRGARLMAEYQLAATELALACNRSRRGLMTEAAFQASRDGSLALMSATAGMIRARRPPSQPSWAALGTSAFEPETVSRPS